MEFYGEHDEQQKVTRIVFLPGQGRLVTLTEDNYLHLWEINGTSIKVTLITAIIYCKVIGRHFAQDFFLILGLTYVLNIFIVFTRRLKQLIWKGD